MRDNGTFDDYVNNDTGSIYILGSHFRASEVLYEMDYNQYESELDDFIDGDYSDYLNDLGDEGEITVYGTTFRIAEEEEKEESDAKDDWFDEEDDE